MPLGVPVFHPVGEEWLYASLSRGGPDPAELFVFATKTHANGRTAIRAELVASARTEVRVMDPATGQTVLSVMLDPGFWPGPTAADKFQLPGNRTLEDTSLTLTL